jgi:hypothetical protein
MRKFKCYDCEHTWELPFVEGGRGVNQSCPKCGSGNIHRMGKGVGRGRWNQLRRRERWRDRQSEKSDSNSD